MSLPTDPVRLLAAVGALVGYAALCIAIAFACRRRRLASAGSESNAGSAAWTVAFASQTGTAEALARQTAGIFQLAGVSVRVCGLSELDAVGLRETQRILFIVSTYGEGDPPDDAARFADRLMTDEEGESFSLAHLHYAVLALGDSTYAAYCGFGKALDRWLQSRGGQPLFERFDVDRGDPATIDAWRRQLSHLAGTDDAPDWNGPAFAGWRLIERRLLNRDSAGAPVFHLELERIDGKAETWRSGDLAQVMPPSHPARPREYSVASIEEDRRVHLLVRLHRHADGTTGHASGWLGTQAAVGEVIQMRLRPHRRFRLEENADRPLILIGNGTGIAGLRGHLRARARTGNFANWLIFGERNAACDFYYHEEVEDWLAAGILQRLDTAFSRDQPQRRYVQHCVLDAGDAVRAWIERGAAIYICGSLKGMAQGVDDALRSLLGNELLDRLNRDGRYRRDVY